jgi:hypothetical protein
MRNKIISLEDLGEEMRAGFVNVRRELSSLDEASTRRHHENRESFKSLGDHLVQIEDKLEELTHLQKLSLRVERIAQHLRERDHAEL